MNVVTKNQGIFSFLTFLVLLLGFFITLKKSNQKQIKKMLSYKAEQSDLEKHIEVSSTKFNDHEKDNINQFGFIKDKIEEHRTLAEDSNKKIDIIISKLIPNK